MRFFGLASVVVVLVGCGSSSSEGAGAETDAGDAGGDATLEAGADAGTEAEAGPASPRPRIVGGQLVDAEGRALILHGVNVSGARKNAPYEGGTDAADLDGIASLGFTHARFLWSWAAAMPTRGTIDQAYVARIASEVHALTQRGLYVLMDCHQDIYGEAIRTAAGPVGNGAPAWSCPDGIASQYTPHTGAWFLNYMDPAVIGCFDNLYADTSLQDDLAAAWGAIAAAVASEPNVLGYDLLNEPFWGSHPSQSWEPSVLVPFYERLAAKIVAADPDAIFFTEPGTNKNVLGVSALTRISSGPVVYAPHLYDANMEGGAAWDGTTTYFENRMNIDAKDGERIAAPVFYGEWGQPGTHANDADFFAALAAAYEKRNLGWTLWDLGPKDSGYAVLGANHQPRPVAMPLARAFVSHLAGSSLVQTFDPATSKLHAEWDASDASTPTIVQVPSSRYAAAPTVNVANGAAKAKAGTIEITASAAGAHVAIDLSP